VGQFTLHNPSDIFYSDIKVPSVFAGLCGCSTEAQQAMEASFLYSKITGEDSNTNTCHHPTCDDISPFTVTVGPSKSGIPMSVRKSSSWNLLLIGKVKWFLIEPGRVQSLHHARYGDNGLFSHDDEFVLESHILPTNRWIEKILPELRSRITVHEVIQLPTEVLYIPQGWYFATLHLSDAVIISQEFCVIKSNTLRVTPLGYQIYGGYDIYDGTIGTLNRLRKSYKFDKKIRQNKKVVSSY
jgi:hypothetical protein